MKGRTVPTIAHRLSPIRDADKIIVLKNGVAAERGTHDQLLALGTYAELYSVQFNKTPAKAAL
jgi:ABC-type multidrug transport system fused ATPase/permease subunit